LYFTVSAPEIVTLNGNELAEVAVDGALFADMELRNLAMQGKSFLSLLWPLHAGFHNHPFFFFFDTWAAFDAVLIFTFKPFFFLRNDEVEMCLLKLKVCFIKILNTLIC